eukprot:6830978-Prymnesium_polylepis.4
MLNHRPRHHKCRPPGSGTHRCSPLAAASLLRPTGHSPHVPLLVCHWQRRLGRTYSPHDAEKDDEPESSGQAVHWGRPSHTLWHGRVDEGGCLVQVGRCRRLAGGGAP